MSDRIIDIVKDLSRYGGMLWDRLVAPHTGNGVDYTAIDFKNMRNKYVAQLHPDRMSLEVIDVIKETPSTKLFRFRRTDGALPPYRPGQYVNLFLTIGNIRTSRPYSMVSSPDQETLELAVRTYKDGFVAPWLFDNLAVGDKVESTGPVGTFCYEPLIHGCDLVFIAGGSGITPFVAMLRDKVVRGDDELKIHLLYGSRITRDVIFKKELEAAAKEVPGFSWSLVISEPAKSYKGLKGFIDADLIRSEIQGDPTKKTWFICGPNALHDLVEASLREIGVPAHRIRKELYGPPADVTKEPGWPTGLSPDTAFAVEVEGHGEIQAMAGEPLMNSLERNGIVIPAECRAGQCSACRTKVLSGKVYMPPSTGLRESDRNYNYVHACVTYPIEDLKIRIAKA